MHRTVLRTFLLFLVALGVMPAAAAATYDRATGSVVFPSGHEIVFGSTGNLVGLQNDIGLAYLDPGGAVLDRRISSWIPGNDEEYIYDGDSAPDGNAWLGANAGGNYTFIEVVPGAPMELDNGPCPNGAITLDLAEDAWIYGIQIVGTKLYAVGSIGEDILVIRLDISTCTIDFAKRIEAAELDGDDTEGYSFTFDGDEIIIAGYHDDLAILVNTDLEGNLDDTFGGGDGFELFDFDGPEDGNSTFFDVEVAGDSIYGVGAGGAATSGAYGGFSVVGRYSLETGAGMGLRQLELAPPGFSEALESMQSFSGELYAVGHGADTNYRAAMARFHLETLEGDADCGGDGDALLQFGSMSTFTALEDAGGSLFGIGFIFNGTESDDYLKSKLGLDCTIDPNFAGGAGGNRIGFIGAPPIGVRQPPGPPGPPPPPQFPAFAEVPLADFALFRDTLINLRRGRIGPITVTGPETRPAGNDDTYRMGLDIGIRIAGGSSAQRRRARRVKLAGRTVSVAEGAQRRVSLKLTKKGKKALRATKGRRVRIQLRLVVRNEAGERRTFNTSQRLRVVRPKKKRRG